MKSTVWIIAGLVAAVASGCSSISKGKSGEEVAKAGPAVVNPRINPGTIEVNRQMQPTQAAEVVAEVKDFNGTVNDVRLRFTDVPFEVKMTHAGGSTWKANLSPGLIRRLTVGNQTTVYNANVYAQDSNGVVGVSNEPLKISVKGPDLAQPVG